MFNGNEELANDVLSRNSSSYEKNSVNEKRFSELEKKIDNICDILDTKSNGDNYSKRLTKLEDKVEKLGKKIERILTLVSNNDKRSDNDSKSIREDIKKLSEKSDKRNEWLSYTLGGIDGSISDVKNGITKLGVNDDTLRKKLIEVGQSANKFAPLLEGTNSLIGKVGHSVSTTQNRIEVLSRNVGTVENKCGDVAREVREINNTLKKFKK